MGIVYCENCGEANNDDYSYCIKCGHVLELTTGETVKLKVHSKGRFIGKLTAVFLTAVLVTAGVVVAVSLYVDSERQEKMERFIVETQDIEKEYLNDWGYVDENKRGAVIDAVYAYAQSLQEKREIAACEKSASGVVMRQKSGETFLYMPETEGLDAGGSGGGIVTLQPFQKETSTSIFISKELKNAPDIAAKASQKFSAFYSFLSDGTSGDDNRDNSEVTLDFIKNLNQYGVIIWDGHGGNWDEFGIVLSTTIPYKEIRSKYRTDINRGLVAENSKGCAVVSHYFFEEYLGGFPETGAIVYLGSCSSGAKDDLADVFLNKGASAVFANSSTVHTIYDAKMTRSVFEALTTLKDKKAQTVSAALKYAQKKNGAQDAAIDGVRSKTLIFGDKNATLRYEKSNTASTTSETIKKTSPKIDYTSSALTGDFDTNMAILKNRLLISTLRGTPTGTFQWDMDGDAVQDFTLIVPWADGGRTYYASLVSNSGNCAFDFGYDASAAGGLNIYYSKKLKKAVYEKYYGSAGVMMSHYTVQSGLKHNYLASFESKSVGVGQPRAEKYNVKGNAVEQKQYEQYIESLKLVDLNEYTADISGSLPSALRLSCSMSEKNKLLKKYTEALSLCGFLEKETSGAAEYRFSTNMSYGPDGDLSAPNGVSVNVWMGGYTKLKEDDGEWKGISNGWRNAGITVTTDKDGLVFSFD